MRILSLFDWIACWYEALLRAGIKIDKYYASEIDKYAIQVAMKNHPDIIQVGDVTQLKWEDFKDVDMIIWGSPCQWFSIAGKQLNFNDPRSALFFEYVRLLNEIKPKYFLLENVKMRRDFQDKISEMMWVQPIEINSALVSAQSRKRLYRTNIPWVKQPKDKWILLKDILQENVDVKYELTDKQKSLIEWKQPSKWTVRRIWWMYGQTTRWWVYDIEWQSPTITASMWMWWWHIPMVPIKLWFVGKDSQWQRVYSPEGKSVSLNALWGGWGAKMGLYMINIPQTVRVRKHEVDIEWLKSELRNRKFLSHLSCKEIADKLWVPQTKVEHRFRLDNSFAIPDEDVWFRLKEILEINTSVFDKSITEFEERDGVYEKATRKISVEWKMTTLTTSWNDEIFINMPNGWYIIRKLTPIECERLQTLPDSYTEWVSDSQRYKALWNGWTVDVIAHIFSFIK